MAQEDNHGTNHYLREIIDGLIVIIEELAVLREQAESNRKTLAHIEVEMKTIMATQAELQAKMAATLAVVEAEAPGIASINALLTGLRQQLADALAGNVPDAVMEQINQIFNVATNNAAGIHDALTPA